MFYCLPNEFVADLVREYLQLLANVKKSIFNSAHVKRLQDRLILTMYIV